MWHSFRQFRSKMLDRYFSKLRWWTWTTLCTCWQSKIQFCLKWSCMSLVNYGCSLYHLYKFPQSLLFLGCIRKTGQYLQKQTKNASKSSIRASFLKVGLQNSADKRPFPSNQTISALVAITIHSKTKGGVDGSNRYLAVSRSPSSVLPWEQKLVTQTIKSFLTNSFILWWFNCCSDLLNENIHFGIWGNTERMSTLCHHLVLS